VKEVVLEESEGIRLAGSGSGGGRGGSLEKGRYEEKRMEAKEMDELAVVHRQDATERERKLERT